MDRLNHVKIVTPDPAAIETFLREVLDIPAGWPLGQPGGPRAASGPPEDAVAAAAASPVQLSMLDVEQRRGETRFRGYIAGSTESRQFQILDGDRAQVWGVAIGTRHVERAYERCQDRGIPCTEPAVTPWGDGSIRFFFAEVGGILFEVMRAEPAISS